ncbi:MAG: NAD(P)-dependent oxidoreductase, partial [Alphaproteobacteria bacterium]|nr:NAD(P)-dependent oxidoreductase [Alphaproteobacteria bacterium]
MSDRVLVTGATGLIGRNVVKALTAAGHVVTAPSRSQANLLDAADRARMLDTARPQTIVHCAWVTDHGAYWT